MITHRGETRDDNTERDNDRSKTNTALYTNHCDEKIGHDIVLVDHLIELYGSAVRIGIIPLSPAGR